MDIHILAHRRIRSRLEIRVFDHDGLTFGMAVCADISVENLFAECARQGAGIVFELAAPGLYGEQATRDWKAGYEMWEKSCLDTFPGYAHSRQD